MADFRKYENETLDSTEDLKMSPDSGLMVCNNIDSFGWTLILQAEYVVSIFRIKVSFNSDGNSRRVFENSPL
jgi:hypothetical protein